MTCVFFYKYFLVKALDKKLGVNLFRKLSNNECTLLLLTRSRSSYIKMGILSTKKHLHLVGIKHYEISALLISSAWKSELANSLESDVVFHEVILSHYWESKPWKHVYAEWILIFVITSVLPTMLTKNKYYICRNSPNSWYTKSFWFVIHFVLLKNFWIWNFVELPETIGSLLWMFRSFVSTNLETAKSYTQRKYFINFNV